MHVPNFTHVIARYLIRPYCVVGATVRVRPDESFNISMNLVDGHIRDTGIWGMRVDYWDDQSSSYPPQSSLFFYDIKENLTVSPFHLVAAFNCTWTPPACPASGYRRSSQRKSTDLQRLGRLYCLLLEYGPKLQTWA